jgi:hypothetical protein
MRFLFCILIPFLCFAANDRDLPKDTVKSLADFDNTKSGLVSSYTKEIIKARDAMVKELDKQYAVEVKKGNLNGAAAIKARNDCLKGNVIIHLQIECLPKTEPDPDKKIDPVEALKTMVIEHRWASDGNKADTFGFDSTMHFYKTNGSNGIWTPNKDGKSIQLGWVDGKIETIVFDGQVGTYQGKPFIYIAP